MLQFLNIKGFSLLKSHYYLMLSSQTIHLDYRFRFCILTLFSWLAYKNGKAEISFFVVFEAEKCFFYTFN